MSALHECSGSVAYNLSRGNIRKPVALLRALLPVDQVLTALVLHEEIVLSSWLLPVSRSPRDEDTDSSTEWPLGVVGRWFRGGD